MSQISIHNGTAYLSGQVAEGGDIRQQTEAVLQKIDGLLAEVGSGKDRIISATVYITRAEDFDAMNEVWDRWVAEGSSPSRTTVVAQLAKPEFMVEIAVIVAV